MTEFMGPTTGRPQTPPPEQQLAVSAAGSPTHRLLIRLFAARYDRMLASGAPVPVGTPLELHTQRITGVAEREALARSLRRSLAEARKPLTMWTTRSWLHRPNVVAAEDLIDTVTLWLHSPRPVDARAMALLRLLLSDGAGPLYMSGRGDLRHRLRSVIATL